MMRGLGETGGRGGGGLAVCGGGDLFEGLQHPPPRHLDQFVHALLCVHRGVDGICRKAAQNSVRGKISVCCFFMLGF